MKDSATIVITCAQAEDIATIAHSWSDIDRHAQPRPFGGDNPLIKQAKTKEMIHHAINSNNAYILKACLADTMVGTIAGHLFERPTSQLNTIGVIYSLWVRDDYQQQGIGQSLLDAIEQKLTAKGARALQVGWDTLNKRAEAWWQKRGYLPYETIASKNISNEERGQ